MPSVGGSPRPLGNLVASEATWSPGGQRILFIHGNDLFIAEGDGTEPRKLLTPPGQPYFIKWSPDGKRISFSLGNDNSNLGHLWEVWATGPISILSCRAGTLPAAPAVATGILMVSTCFSIRFGMGSTRFGRFGSEKGFSERARANPYR